MSRTLASDEEKVDQLAIPCTEYFRAILQEKGKDKTVFSPANHRHFTDLKHLSKPCVKIV